MKIPVLMKTCQENADLVVRLDYQKKVARITVVQWGAMARKMTRLYGRSLDTDLHNAEKKHEVFTARWEVPLKAISFRRVVAVKAKAAGV